MSAVYLWSNGRQDGPFNLEEIRMLLQSGKASPQTLCCKEGDPEWKPLSDLAALVPAPDLSLPSPPISSSVQQPAWSELQGTAAAMQSMGMVFLFLAGLFFAWLMIACFGSDWQTMNIRKLTLPTLLTAGSLSGAFILSLFAQLLHIRSALDRRNR